MAYSLFRSEKMSICQLFLHTDSAYTCIAEIGELGLVQFRDTEPRKSIFHRKFITEVRRCNEMERKLKYLESEIKKDGIPLLDTNSNPPAPESKEVIDLEASLEKLENELKSINTNVEALKKSYYELLELRHLLKKAQMVFDKDTTTQKEPQRKLSESIDESTKISLASDELDQKVQFIAGVMARKNVHNFELMLWRACRGNVFIKQAEIDEELFDPVSGEVVRKSVFIAFFQGNQLRARVQKISEAFHANLYPCPDTRKERREMSKGVLSRIEELETVLKTSQEHRHYVLVTAAKMLREWFIKVGKIKAIYHILNLFNMDVTSRAMIGECWCAVNDLDTIHNALQRGMVRSNASVAPILNRMPIPNGVIPPTFHRTNKFTKAFQNIVDAYGVACYREINPAPFTCITFPFLFAVMFGDCGHGLLMTLFALWMVVKERTLMIKNSNNEIWNTFFIGRYIILLMGLFSIYTGLIYNDAFSKSINIFGSAWKLTSNQINNGSTSASVVLQPDQNFIANKVYPFGIDPMWQDAKNKITFTNSVKMKLSIILGVMHMVFGICLSFGNYLYFKDYLSIICEFIPRLIFLNSIFGYLIVLIFIKWLRFGPNNSGCAPSLLLTLINMVMGFGEVKPINSKCDGKIFHEQELVQRVLISLALVCIPWMLFVRPMMLFLRHNNKTQFSNIILSRMFPLLGYDLISEQDHMEASPPPVNNEVASGASGTAGAAAGREGGEDVTFEVGDILVFQCIQTIEFCLGCISNTASYLRLWALSLAHGQLSEVLWSMIFRMGLSRQGFTGALFIALTFMIWSILTVAILLFMEGLSTFLHALRLHWMEFQNKYYTGEGHNFEPFCFEINIDKRNF